MTFFELLWKGANCGDAGDLEEALTHFQELRPKHLSWAEVCSDPALQPPICRFRSFAAFLDNEDALETIPPTAEMLERFQPEEVEPDEPEAES